MNEEVGYWWFAGFDQAKASGKLERADHGATLRIVFDDKISHHDAYFGLGEIIYGVTSSGQKISLIDFFETSHSGNTKHAISKTYFVNRIIYGAHIPANNDVKPTYQSAILPWNGLKVLFGRTGFTFDAGAHDFKSMQLNYLAPKKISVNLGNGLTIEISYFIDRYFYPSPETECITISENLSLCLIPDVPKEFNYYEKATAEIRDFFSICIGDYSSPDALTLIANFDCRTTDNGENLCPRVTTPLNYVYKSPKERKVHSYELFIPYEEISGEMPLILATWLDISDKLAPIKSLYFSALYTDHTNHDASFLALSQALEVFHRRFRAGTILPKKNFKEKVREPLRNAIPSDLPQDALSIFEQRLGYLNELSLRNRILELMNEHETVLSAYVGVYEKIAKRIADARNYYTHYSENASNRQPTFRDLIEYKSTLALLLSLCMLKESNMPIEIIHSRALASQKYKWMFSGFRKIER